MKDADHDLFGLPEVKTQCGFCLRIVPLVEATVSTFHITETFTDIEHFCSPECAKDWWLNFQAKDD